MNTFTLALALTGFWTFASAAEGKKPNRMEIEEVKVDVAAADIDATLSGLSIKDSEAENRTVTFFDTSDLSLFKSNLILRLRAGQSGSDITVKIRPIDPSRVSDSWFAIKGFKCDTDVTRDARKAQCAYKGKLDEDEANKVAKGKDPLSGILDRDQIRFAQTYGVQGVDWDSLRPLGPIQSKSWSIDDTVAGSIGVELWALPNGMRYLEISQDVPNGQEEGARNQMLNLLQSLRVHEDSVSGNKTEFVMQYFASQH